MFLGAANIRPLLILPLLSETLPQKHRTGQNLSPSEGAGETAASETKFGREVLPGAWSQRVKKRGVDES